MLVLLRLDDRRWQIPDRAREGSFDELVSYLQGQADLLRSRDAAVKGLAVVGIDCVRPSQ